jgi:hypothetical protein
MYVVVANCSQYPVACDMSSMFCFSKQIFCDMVMWYMTPGCL